MANLSAPNIEPGSTLLDTNDAPRVAEIESRLRRVYGAPRHHNPRDPLDDLIFLVLSRMTQEVKYVRTYTSLRSRYPSWSDVLNAPQTELVGLLRDAGLAHTKAAHIQAILLEVREREGTLDLSRLESLGDDDVRDYLASLPGVAAKTALCVMLYALGRDTFPVDAHVWRLSRRLALVPNDAWSERRSDRLASSVPKPLRASLHVTFLAHGRAVCKARRPLCDSCQLTDLCPTAARLTAE